MYFWKKNNYDYSDNKHYSDKHAYNEKYEKTNKWFNNNSDSCGKEKQSIENKMTQMYCNNCGKYGHLFSNCVLPITSLGIIAFRKKTESEKGQHHHFSISETGVIDGTVTSKNGLNEFEYLMIQRIDSFGYIEFMRGKYSIHSYGYLKNIIDEMTIQEKRNILTKPFDELWVSLWGEYSGLQYKGEQQTSKNKYLQLKAGVESNGVKYNLESLISSSVTTWETAEWGFPKGRRNHQEKDLECAFREFTEETGYDRDCLKQIFNILPYEETFIGSNIKAYKNKYFLCYMNSDQLHTSGYQKSEVKNMKWLTYVECMEVIRPYNIEKKNMLTSINNTLHKFYICNI